MYKNLFACLLLCVLSMGCKEDVKVADPKTTEVSHTKDSFKRAFSDGDYNFQVEYNNRLDTSYLDILYLGKKVQRYGFTGRIKNEFLVDLNMDKQNEVFIEAGNDSFSQLFGYYLESGKSTEIVIESRKDNFASKPISYKVERNQLVEKYSVQLEEGGEEQRVSKYNLVNRNGQLVLLPQGLLPVQLEKMSGQYVTRDAKGAGYYKVMLLKDNGGGVWNVDIKVKRNGDKKILCNFNGEGFFLDGNLMVPLKDVAPELKGVLKIRFLELMAAVYTEDPLDNKEMISFCEGMGSIAGNFKKTNI